MYTYPQPNYLPSYQPTYIHPPPPAPYIPPQYPPLYTYQPLPYVPPPCPMQPVPYPIQQYSSYPPQYSYQYTTYAYLPPRPPLMNEYNYMKLVKAQHKMMKKIYKYGCY